MAAILALPLVGLADALRRGELRTVDVLDAYLSRARDVQHATNAITVFAGGARAEAEAADAHLAATGRPLGPLHGVPVSIKDHYQLKGHPVTMGLRGLKDAQAKSGGAKRDAALVVALRDAGAVVFCKTNMTQLGDTWGGGNPAWGDSLNPWDTLRTTGGSSSGEGALVGANASPLGFGSDVGGSVRIPAAFCGVVGLKPTAQRFTFNAEDARTIMNHPGDYGILATGGPLARTVDDVILAMRALWRPGSALFELDRVPPIPFDEGVLSDSRPLRVGVCTTEGHVYPAPCPSCVRAVEEAAAALAARGHTVVPFAPGAEGVAPPREVEAVVLGLYGGGKKDPSALPPPPPDPAANSGSYGGGPLAGEEIHPDLAAGMAGGKRGTDSAVATKDMLPRPTSMGSYLAVVAARDRLRDKVRTYQYYHGFQLLPTST